MPYFINWYIKNEIIYAHYSGINTPDELRESLLEMRAYIESSSHSSVHIITDVGDVIQPVSVKDTIKILRDIGTHRRMGWQITLREPSMLMRMAIRFGTVLFTIHSQTFDHIDEAVNFLKTQDDTINWDNINASFISQ